MIGLRQVTLRRKFPEDFSTSNWSQFGHYRPCHLIILRLNVHFRPIQCRIWSGEQEAFPLHSFDDDEVCKDNRLQVQVSGRDA